MKSWLPAVIFLAALPLSGWSAGGHYPVDDADITPSGELVVESWWTRFDADNREFAVLPTWTVPDTTLELVGGLIRETEGGENFNVFEPQAKYLIQPFAPGQWGLAVYAHAQYQDADNRWDETLFNVPVSYEMADMPAVVHLNAGWIRQQEAGWNDRAFLGTAAEWDTGLGADVIGQVYREGADAEPEAQLGLRFHSTGLLDYADVALGRELSGDNDWFFTVGIGLTL